MKVLYICPNFDNATYSYYGLIVNGLKNIGCDIKVLRQLNNFDILNSFDVAIFGYRGFNKNLYGKKINTKCKLYNLLGAQSTQEFPKKGETLNNNNILNLVSMFRINYLKEKYFKNSIQFNYSFYPSIFKDYGQEKTYDIGITGALHCSDKYPKDAYIKDEKNIRTRVCRKLEKMKSNYKIFIKCSDTVLADNRIMNDIDYAKKINSTKIWISCHAAYGDNCRNFQIPPCKTLLFCNEPIEKSPYIDIFKDGENCVYFKSDLSDFEEKLNYYLNNKKEYDRIVENGYKEFHKKHTNIQRAKELLKIIKKNNK